jgi:AbrB family looped-hinge helix DNA binding protein
MANKVKVKPVRGKRVKAIRRGRTSTSRVSAKHQVTVPVDILRAMGLEAGDKVKFEVQDGKIAITPDKNVEHPLGLLIGAGKGAYDNFDLAKEREAMWPR